MYGLINRFVAHPGRRDDLVAAMTSDVGPLPGCRSFVVAHDPKDADAVWITEVWDSKAAWEASMDIPGVKASIAVAMPLIAAFGDLVETVPVGGHGLGNRPPPLRLETGQAAGDAHDHGADLRGRPPGH